MPGPPPTPTETLKARGSWRAKNRTGEPGVPVEKPTCPAWLKGEGRAEWNRQVKLLEQARLLAKLDRATLALYCEAWGEFVGLVEALGQIERELTEARAAARAEGDPADRAGKAQRREAERRAARLEKRLWRAGVAKARAATNVLKLSDRFGFSPSARARVRVSAAPADKDTSKARFFKPRVAEGT